MIDGSQSANADSASVVYFLNGEDTTAVLLGFTITGERAPSPAPSFPPQPKRVEAFIVSTPYWDIGLLKIFEMVHRWRLEEAPVTYADYPLHGDPAAAELAREYLFQQNIWSRAKYKMAEIYLQRGAYEHARNEYAAVALFAPEDPYPYLQIAATFEQQQDWPKRELYLRTALPLSDRKGNAVLSNCSLPVASKAIAGGLCLHEQGSGVSGFGSETETERTLLSGRLFCRSGEILHCARNLDGPHPRGSEISGCQSVL